MTGSRFLRPGRKTVIFLSTTISCGRCIIRASHKFITGRRIILVCTDQTTHGSCKVVPVTSGGRTSQSVPSTICQQLSKACFSCPVTTASWESRRLIPDWWVDRMHSGWNSWILGCTWNTTVVKSAFELSQNRTTFYIKTLRYQPRSSAVSLYAGKCSYDCYAD